MVKVVCPECGSGEIDFKNVDVYKNIAVFKCRYCNREFNNIEAEFFECNQENK